MTGVIMILKKLCKNGNSWSVIIPKSILDGFGINPVLDKVSIEIEPDGIKIKKHKEQK